MPVRRENAATATITASAPMISTAGSITGASVRMQRLSCHGAMIVP